MKASPSQVREAVPEERRRRRWWSSGGVARCRRRLPLAARYAAINGTTSWQEWPAQKGGAASGAAEAGLGRVPVLTLVRHLALVNADRFATAVAILGEGGIEAAQTVRPALSHDVSLAAELRKRIVPVEMLHLDGNRDKREQRVRSISDARGRIMGEESVR